MVKLTACALAFVALAICSAVVDSKEKVKVTAGHEAHHHEAKIKEMQLELGTFKTDVLKILNDVKDEMRYMRRRIRSLESEGQQTQRHSVSRRRRDVSLNLSGETNDTATEDSAEDISVDQEIGIREIEKRLETVEAKLQKTTARSCQALITAGQTTPGYYLIDPDGADVGEPPIRVYCDWNEEDGTWATVIKHDSSSFNVKQCSSPGCSKHEINYDVPIRQINALVDISESCSQQITYHCFDAPLSMWETFHNAWWTGRDPEAKNYYWTSGAQRNEHTCACGLAGNCTVERVLKCNCDAGEPAWLSDEGKISDKDSLPIRSLNFGGLKYATQQARAELGPLRCSGMDMNVLTKFDSCLAMRAAGHRASGYYILDSKTNTNGTKANRVVECNFDLEPLSPGFEHTIKHIHRRVTFDAYRTNSLATSDHAVMTYDGVQINLGDGLNPESGFFFPPVDGAYYFNFVGKCGGDCSVRLTTREGVIATNGYSRGYNGGSGYVTLSTIVSLTTEDTAHITFSGEMPGGRGYAVHFVGFLLHEFD